MSDFSDRPATIEDYRLLDVPVGVADEALRQAFKTLARRAHPDINPHDPGAEARFKRIQAAFFAISKWPLSRQAMARSAASPATAPAHRPAAPPRPAAPRATPRPRREPRLVWMEPGAILWVSEAALLVAPDRTCTLDPAAAVSLSETRERTVAVTRLVDGYEVRLHDRPESRWSISTRRDGLAVSSLTIGGRAQRASGRHQASGGAHLPHELLGSSVADVPLGARRFTVLSALRINRDGEVWLDRTESVCNEPTFTTPVRVELFADGYHVHSDIPYPRWPRGQLDAQDGRWLEVTAADLGGTVVRRRDRGDVTSR